MADAQQQYEWVVVQVFHFPLRSEKPVTDAMSKDRALIERDVFTKDNILPGVTYEIQPREVGK